MNNGEPLDQNAAGQLNKRWHLRIIIIFAAVITAAIVLLLIAGISMRPIFIGCFLALLMKPMCNVLDRLIGEYASRKQPLSEKKLTLIHLASITITYIVWFGIVLLFFIIVIPRVGVALTTIVSKLPTFIDELYHFALSLVDDGGIFSDYSENIIEIANRSWTQWYATELQPMLNKLAGAMLNGISGMFSLIFDIFVGAIISAYLLASRKKLAAQGKLVIYAMCGANLGYNVINEFKFANKMFSGYFVGHLIDSALVGLSCYLGMLILKIPYAVLVSVIVGVTNMIPFFGPYIGAIPSAIIIMTESPIKAVIFFIMAMLIQQIDGNIICPKIVGSSTGLSSFWVLFAILLFSGLFGFIGMLFGVPIFAVVYDIIEKFVRYCLEKRGQHAELEQYDKQYPDEKTVERKKRSDNAPSEDV